VSAASPEIVRGVPRLMRIGAGIAVSAIIIVSVCVAAAPVTFAATAGNDSATTNEDTPVVINVLANDSGTGLAISAATAPTHGTVAIIGSTITYTPSINWSGTDSFQYTITEGSTLYCAATGHYYQYVTSHGITWYAAASAASASVFEGRQGYLVTIGSQSEQDFVQTKLEGQGWMGASDEAQEGIWKWVTGPAADQKQFCTQTGGSIEYAITTGGSNASGSEYQHWASGEPNNANYEDHGHFLLGGQWNDFKFDNPNIEGYVVEYGGMPDDSPTPSVTATVSVVVNPVNDAPTISAGSALTVNEDSGSVERNVIVPFDPDSSSFTYSAVTGPTKGTASFVNSKIGTYTYTPSPNANGTDSFTWKVNDGSLDSNVVTQTITITAVNDAPNFTKGADQTVLEDCGFQTISGWATSIIAGPSNESGQTLNFIVTNNNNGLFSAQPSITSNGTLAYTPAANATSSATVTVRIHDNGGTTNGGVDTSAAQTFTITVTSVNDPPSFMKGTDQTVSEDCGAVVVSGWATAISPGPSNEWGQVLAFNVSNDNSSLFSTQPAINANGTLSYTPASDVNGITTVTVTLTDDATAGDPALTTAPQTFTITVTPVNDAPSFTKGPDQSVVEDCGPQTVASWATAISAGPTDEASQTIDFLVSNDRNALFSMQPVVSPARTLTYTPAPNKSGVATVTVRIHDNGGMADGGVAASALQAITITVSAANDAPVNTTPPAISGTPHIGRTLTTTDGLWNDAVDLTPGVLSYSYQWQRSTNGGTTYTDIPGATNPTYTLTITDTLQLVRSSVTCTDDGEGLPVHQSTSAASAPVTVLNAAPVISEGAATFVTCDEDENPLPFGLTLHAVDADGIDVLTWHIAVAPSHGLLTCTTDPNGLAMSPAYHPVPNWNGTDNFVLRVEDGLGGCDEISVTVIVNPRNDAPVSTLPPSIDGDVFMNHEVSTMIGSWNDNVDLIPGELGYTFQWLRASDAAGSALVLIPGAIASSYVVSPFDEGMYLAVRVTCSDDGEGLPTAMSTSADSGFVLVRYLDVTSPTIELPDLFTWPGVTNYSNSATSSFTVTNAAFSLPFTVEDDRLSGVQVSISVGGRTVVTSGSGSSSSHTLQLAEGPNSVVVSAVDAAGNVSSRHLSITLDSHAPVVTLSTTLPSTTASSRLSLVGSIRDSYSGIRSLSIDGVAVIPYADGTFRYELNLKKGENTIVVAAMDGVGNSGSQTYHIKYTAAVAAPVSSRQTMVLAIGSRTMTVGGIRVALDAPAIIVEDRTLVPLRAIVEHLGGSIVWNTTKQQVTVKAWGTTIVLTIGKSVTLVNGRSLATDPENGKVVPLLMSSRTMLPLRFVAENLGLQVDWNAKTRVVTLSWDN
jgi:hypothetical protein